MKIYQVHLYTEKEGSSGFSYHSSMRDASKTAKQFSADTRDNRPDCSIRILDIKPGKAGLIRALNTYGGHPDNG